MIIDVSRGEIQLDDLFNAIEQDKDQVTQALEIYGDYLKVKNDNSVNGESKIEILERILKLECIEKTVINPNHENERSRINLKWTVLSECGIWHRKLHFYDKAINYFEKANAINNQVSTIYYEMGLCYLELGNVYQVKTCFEKTIEISHEHVHWRCLEQIIYLYYILGNYSKCLEYVRIGYNHAATYQSMYDFGQICLILLEKSQPSMKNVIDKMFKDEIEFVVYDESLQNKVEELRSKIRMFKEKLLKNVKKCEEKQPAVECLSIESFEDFGQYLTRKIRESNNDSSKLCQLIDIKSFLPKQNVTIDNSDQQPEPMVTEEEPPQPTVQRKKRSSLPLNIDDYEKRRSARSINRVIPDDTNISTTDQLRRLISNNENGSDDEADENDPSPKNLEDEIAPTLLTDIPKENFSQLQVDYPTFIQSVVLRIEDGYQYHYFDLINHYINELIKHSSTQWPNDTRMTFVRLFDSLLDYVQYSTTEIDPNHLRACLCYVENAFGSAKCDLSEDSIERFSCLARVKTKYKSLGYCFGRLQLYLYLFKNSSIQQQPFEIDEIFYRVLWISSLYYFLSDDQDEALACVYQLQRMVPDTTTVILPNLFNHTTISKSSIEKLYIRLKDNSDVSSAQASSSSSSQELTYILSRIAVAEEHDELSLLVKKLDKKIKLFYANLKTQINLQRKSLTKCYETLVNVLNENQHLKEKENLNARKVFDHIFIQIIDMIIKTLDDDSKWEDASLKIIERSTITLMDSIMKRDASGNSWPFNSVKPWILLYRVAMKRDPKKNEQFILSYVRTIHDLFGKQEKCLVESGTLLEYFLLELIQIEHPDIRKRLLSNTICLTTPSDESGESNEQKSKLSKVMDEIEQCIYCLYGLVLRKSKMKYLSDHSCRSLELTLEKASIVFYALRPRQVPGYEGRTCTITNETESLFQRFESMIDWDDEREERRKLLLSYIADASSINSQGKQSDELIRLSDQPFKLRNALFERDLYYLFADYYLKMGSKDAITSESSKKKAQEYYIKDLCLNTKRFDSWAGLTVVEFSKIEEFITADDFDPRIFNVHMSASCFFRQAVSVDSNNHTLWMEYAEITYILQAYCSKYKDKATEYVPDRSFLLNICKEAYEKANLCTDNDENKEDWAYLYMMAKIEEKLHRSKLFNALKKYVAALDLIHENKAVYPRKLGHHTATSNSKGTLLGCHAVEMFYRIHASSLKYLNRHSKETADFTIEKLNELYEFLLEMQNKPFATSYYEKSTISSDAHSGQLIQELYFSQKSDTMTTPWLAAYSKCIWLCVEGLYICIARYNRHYRGLYRLAHFFHTNEYYRNDQLSLEFLLGGKVLELRNYPKIVGLYQERSKHNLFNGIWRIQPLDADRTGSFNSSMYKSTRLFVDLLLQSEEHLLVLLEVLRQLLDKPDLDKKYLREVERKMLCQHAVKVLFRTIKKKVLLKTRDDIEREGLQIIASMDETDPNNISLPVLFEISIKSYTLIKNYPEFHQNSRFNELVEQCFQRYRSILKYSSHLPENPKAENLTVIYTPKKSKPKKRPASTTDSSGTIKRPCVESQQHSVSDKPVQLPVTQVEMSTPPILVKTIEPQASTPPPQLKPVTSEMLHPPLKPVISKIPPSTPQVRSETSEIRPLQLELITPEMPPLQIQPITSEMPPLQRKTEISEMSLPPLPIEIVQPLVSSLSSSPVKSVLTSEMPPPPLSIEIVQPQVSSLSSSPVKSVLSSEMAAASPQTKTIFPEIPVPSILRSSLDITTSSQASTLLLQVTPVIIEIPSPIELQSIEAPPSSSEEKLVQQQSEMHLSPISPPANAEVSPFPMEPEQRSLSPKPQPEEEPSPPHVFQGLASFISNDIILIDE